MPVALEQIKKFERGTMGDRHHDILPVLDVLGVDVPEAPAWRRQRDEENRAIERRLARMEREDREWEARQASRSTPVDFALNPLPSLDTTVPYQREGPRVGRNDPRPCGSGKKYKKCCGKK